jgi:drug/metabolite transporter superfamily protein YnfA
MANDHSSGSPFPLASSIQRSLIIQGTITVERVAVLSLLLVATTLEAGGDAVVRVGLHQHVIGIRALLLLLGGKMLFCYGVVLNQAPFDFGRLIGAYVATFFLVGQVINLVAFRASPSVPVILGGLLIVAGGAVITLGGRPA